MGNDGKAVKNEKKGSQSFLLGDVDAVDGFAEGDFGTFDVDVGILGAESFFGAFFRFLGAFDIDFGFAFDGVAEDRGFVVLEEEQSAGDRILGAHPVLDRRHHRDVDHRHQGHMMG